MPSFSLESARFQISIAQSECSRRSSLTEKKVASVGKELLISFIGLVIALIFSALALGIANWGIGVARARNI